MQLAGFLAAVRACIGGLQKPQFVVEMAEGKNDEGDEAEEESTHSPASIELHG
jgi:hypothetical protein